MTTHDHAPNRLPKQVTSPRRRRQVLAAAILATCALSPARANTNTWTGLSGYWYSGYNWSLHTVPASGDTAFLTQSDTLNRTVTLNTSPSLAGLTIDSTGTGEMTLSQSAYTLSVGSTGEYVGYSGAGTYVLTAGTNSTTAPLRIGYNAGATGAYTLANSGSLNVRSTEYIGFNGTGALIQTGGMNTVGGPTSGLIDIALAAGSSGSYTLTGGTASAYRVFVGGSTSAAGGTGVLNIGGSASLTTTNLLKVWDTPGTAVNFTGGSLTVGGLNTSNNPSRFNWTAGTLNVTGGAFYSSDLGTSITLSPSKSLVINNGYLNLAAGTSLTIAGGSLLAGTSSGFYIPSGATVSLAGGTLTTSTLNADGGTFAWTAGTLNITNHGTVSLNSHSLGTNFTLSPSHTLSMSDGYLTIPAGSNLSVAGGSISSNGSSTNIYGAFTLSAGTVSTTDLTLGAYSVDYKQPGTLSVSGGTLSVAGTLTTWSEPGTTFTLSGGTVSLGALSVQSIPSNFNWTAGTLAFTGNLSPSATNIGSNFTLLPDHSLSVAGTLSVSSSNPFTLNGGSLTVDTFNATSPDAFSWTSGTLAFPGGLSLSQTNLGYALDLPAARTLSIAGTFTIGTSASVTIDGGTLTAGATAIVSNDVALNGGTADFGDLTLDSSHNTRFTQTGGTATIQDLKVGRNETWAVASYSLSNGSLIVHGNEYLGLGKIPLDSVVIAGVGIFNQTGGQHIVDQTLYVGYGDIFARGSGTLNLSAGSLAVAGGLCVGYASPGTLAQTGGTLAVTNGSSLCLAYRTGSSGTYYLSAGTASAANIYVGGSDSAPGGAATLSLTGGSLSTPGTLKIYNSPNTSVSLSGGTLSLASLDTSGNPSLFHWTAGTLSFTSSPPDLSPTGPLGPSLKLSPGMTLRTTSLPTLSSPSSLDISGGSLVVAYTGPSPADQLRADLQAGLISSSAAAADPQHPLALGYTDSSSTLTVQLTPLGDANLDGQITPDDYALLDRAYARSLPNAHWSDGDFNYDGAVDASDYLLIDTTFGQAQGFSPGFLAQRESQFGAPYVSALLSTVPEPTPALSSILYLLSSLPLTRRRRPLKIRHTFQ